jgi:hypothetical protein
VKIRAVCNRRVPHEAPARGDTGDGRGRTAAPSSVARFDQAAEITLGELRVELMYPFDDAADQFFHRRAANAPLG